MNKKELKKYFAKDLKHGWFWRHQSQAIFKFLMGASEFCKNGVVLDAGAGRQRYKPFFEDSVYVSQEHIEGINMKNMHNVEYDLIGPIDEKIPLRDNSVDGILSTSVVEHLRYPERFFREAYRVLRPGGKLFINCPFCYPEHEEPFDFNRPTRYGLQEWLKSAGFGDIAIEPSSSCTEAVCSFFAFSVWNDIRKGNKPGGEILRENFFRLPLLCLAKAVYAISEVICFLVKISIDRGPHRETTFPIGWLAVATKEGKNVRPESFKDKKEFLERHKNG